MQARPAPSGWKQLLEYHSGQAGVTQQTERLTAARARGLRRSRVNDFLLAECARKAGASP